MRKIILIKNKVLIIVLIFIFIFIFVIAGLISFKSIYKKDNCENEGINMTEEKREIVYKVIALAESKIGFQYVWDGKGEI